VYLKSIIKALYAHTNKNKNYKKTRKMYVKDITVLIMQNTVNKVQGNANVVQWV